MTEEQLKQYLSENLKIEFEEKQSFGGGMLIVKLLLNEEEISRDSIYTKD